MQAIILENGQYKLQECGIPQPGKGEVLVKIAYAGANRADLFQAQGKYPLPEGNPAIPGLEISGEIVACGEGVNPSRIGEKVCALLSEGAFAEYAVVPEALALPVPENMSLEEAAALPEAAFTAWISLVWQAELKKGETVLIHGGASGVGSLAIQIAKALGATVFTTAGTDEKCAACLKAGASHAINYHTQDFAEQIKQLTGGKGVDVILDIVGGEDFARNLQSLAHGGRLCIIAFLKGAKITANLSPILLKHLKVMGSTLRSRPLSEKTQIAVELRDNLWHIIAQGQIKPVIDRIFPLKDAQKALDRMEQRLNIGKILIKMQS
ncbi:MAG TPA: NAD(P)H-quinone oxidoreductase [Rickettsiales bacterium]|nr:NAD(P)H-quinone oxidoreductase [Rickettsiales bacterium]